MSPGDETAAMQAASSGISAAVESAYKKLIASIRAGTAPRDAVESAMASFTGEYAEVMAANLGAVIGESLTADDALALDVGNIKLSSRLYAHTAAATSIVEGVVRKHAAGFSDAKALALELYEGYNFNPTEPLNLIPGNDLLPKHLRESLLTDNAVKNQLARAYSRAQTKALRTGALKASYTELLRAIDAVGAGAGQKFLDKKLWVAFNEKARYFANRIAQTELARAIGVRRAKEYMLDTDLEYVQWRLSPSHPEYDICDYFAGLNQYGLGKGVYPKALAPVPPAHPHCRCRLSVRLDLTGKTPEEIADAQESYFNTLPPDKQRMVAGSAVKLDRVNAGESAMAVHNSRTDPIYQVKTVSDIN